MSSIIAKVTQLGPRIIRILGCNPGPMTLQGTNTYLIGTGKKRVLLDVGEQGNTEYISSLVSVLKQHNTTVDQIVISHWHHDHIGGLDDVLQSLPGVSGGSELPIQKAMNVYKMPRKDAEDDPLPDEVSLTHLAHHDEIKTAGATLRVHHTPGHTTDHVVLELVEEGAVFSGDCVLGEGTAVFEDLHSYMSSLELLVGLSPRVIYPGHGPVIEDPVDRIQQYISHRNQREQQILSALADSSTHKLTPMELVKTIYKETPEHLHLAAANNVSHHLSKLLKERKVVKEGERWCLAGRQNKL